MLYKKYTGKVLCGFPSHHWPQGEAEVREFYIIENRRLDKAFYFYMHTPKDPIVLNEKIFKKSTGYVIHPGLNRYLGLCFRDEPVWADAIIISQGEPMQWPNVEILDFIDEKDIEERIDDSEWAKIGAEMPKDQERDFFESCTEYVNSLLVDTKAYIITENGKEIYLKETGTKEIVVYVKECNSFIDAIKKLFREVYDYSKRIHN